MYKPSGRKLSPFFQNDDKQDSNGHKYNNQLNSFKATCITCRAVESEKFQVTKVGTRKNFTDCYWSHKNNNFNSVWDARIGGTRNWGAGVGCFCVHQENKYVLIRVQYYICCSLFKTAQGIILIQYFSQFISSYINLYSFNCSKIQCQP